MNAKSKKDSDFIEKIKTIGIIVGGKPSKADPTVCESCGEPMKGHLSGVAIPIPESVAKSILSHMAPKHDESSEASFSA
jgi:hypothetical protein